MQEVRWGIIGCGDVTEVKSGPALYKIDGSSLVAVMRRTGDLAKDYAVRHGVPAWYDDADALIHNPNVNAVYIATPPDSHLEYTVKVAQAGKPVYVEKPMARNYAECQQMIAACEAAGVPLWVGYYRRALPNHLQVKTLIDSGAIGEVRAVNIRLYWPADWQTDFGIESPPWRVQPALSGGGYFVDLAAHQFDFLDYALGPIAEAQGQAANQAGLYAAEDIVTANFRFESNVLGSGVWCFSSDEVPRTDENEIIGTAGRIRFSSFSGGPIVLETADRVQEFDPPMPQHVHQPLVQTLVDELLDRGGVCPSTGISGARASWVMDEILQGWRASVSV